MLLNRPAINRRLEAEKLKAAVPVTMPKEQITKADTAKASPKRKTGASRKPRSKKGKDA